MTKEIFSWDTHYLAFTLVLRMRRTWVRKIPDLQTIQDRLPHSCMGPVTSYRLRWEGGGGEWGAGGGGGRRILGLNGMLFRGIRSIIQWDNQILRFPPPTPHLSPQAINMTGSLTENFNRKLWCVHRPLLYGISETFPYSTIFICLFQCDCASIKWLVLV